MKSGLIFVLRSVASLTSGMGVIFLWRAYRQLVWYCESMLDRWLVWDGLGQTVFESILGPITNLIPFIASGAVTALVFPRLRPVSVGIFLTAGAVILGDWETGWVFGFGLRYRDCLACPVDYWPIAISAVALFAAMTSAYAFVASRRASTVQLLESGQSGEPARDLQPANTPLQPTAEKRGG